MTDSKSASEAEAAKPKRQEKITRLIKFSDGTEGKRLKTGLTPVGFDLVWAATGEKYSVSLDAVPEASKANGLVFGLITNFTNAAGGKESSMQDILDRAELVMGGEWAEAAGEGGPSPTLLAEAFHRAYAAKGKTHYNDGAEFTLEEVTKRMKSYNADQRKTAKADSFVAVAYLEIEAERTKERLKKAKAAVKEAPADTSIEASFL